MKFLVLVLLIGLFAFSEQPSSGVFIIKKPSKKNPCDQQLKMLIGSKSVCVLKKPIISIDEVVYVTEILYDPYIKANYIELGLSPASVKTLNQTIASIPKVQFALVIDSNVICTIMINEGMATRYLRIGADLDQKSLIVVRDFLKQVE